LLSSVRWNKKRLSSGGLITALQCSGSRISWLDGPQRNSVPSALLINLVCHRVIYGSLLPMPMVAALQEALPHFARRIKGYDHPDALLTAVETRTSSPLRIPRDEHFESINTVGLTPAGEGGWLRGGNPVCSD
jgi:hypothetical protein